MCLENILGLEKKLVMEYKQVFLVLKMSFKITLKIIYLVKKGEIVLVGQGWTKTISHYESYGKKDKKNAHNIR